MNTDTNKDTNEDKLLEINNNLETLLKEIRHNQHTI